MSNNNQTALSVRDLSVNLWQQPETEILKKVSFDLHPGKVYALVGESGSGKSMTALSIMRLLPDALQITKGKITLANTDIFSLTEQEMGGIRGKKVAMIFQDAQTSLNPVQKISDQIIETLKIHTPLKGSQLKQRAVDLLHEVGIPDPESRVDWYPHQMSGGQQQRVMIAIALACEPDVLLADEPTTALDVTIQKQILDLIKGLTVSRKLAVLLITHDMGVVRQTADRVGVMLQGEIIEEDDCDQFFDNPRHKYSQRLINSLPNMTEYRPQVSDGELLKVEDLQVHFPMRKGILQRIHGYTKAVDGISFSIKKGETLALVGESGSGKSTTGMAILNLQPATGGQIQYANNRIEGLTKKQMMPLRKKIQVVFQNPYSSMNPTNDGG